MDLAKEELQAFNPRDPLYRWKLWVRVVCPDSVYYHVFWGRLTAAMAVFAVAAWMIAAAGAWQFMIHKRQWKEAHYMDILLYPWRSDEFRHGLGQHYLAQGKVELQNKNYATGYNLLLAGLRRVPEDLAARKIVAITHVRAGQLQRALKTLAEGLAYNPDLDYLKLAFGWHIEAREFDRVIQLATPLLPPAPTGDLKHYYLALQIATAHFECGRYDQTEQWIARWSLQNSLEGLLLLAHCDWETGRKEEALRRLANEVARFPNRDEIYVGLIRFHRELGNEAEARRFALLRQFNDPQSPGPRIDLLHTYRATHDTTAENREIGAYLSSFADDAKAIGLLAWYAVDTHQPAVLERVREHASNHSLALEEIDLARVQLALIAHRYKEAMEISDAAASAAAKAEAARPTVIAGLNAVATYASGDRAKASVSMRSFIAKAQLPLCDTLLLARELQLVGAMAEARLVLETACASDPFAQPALAELLRMDAATRNHEGLAVYLPKFLALQKPSRAVLVEVLLALDRVSQPELVERVRAVLMRTTEGSLSAAPAAETSSRAKRGA